MIYFAIVVVVAVLSVKGPSGFVLRKIFFRKFIAEFKNGKKNVGPEPIFGIIIFEWNHVLKILSKNMMKMLFSQKIHYSKTNKAIDVVFAEKLTYTLLYKYMVK